MQSTVLSCERLEMDIDKSELVRLTGKITGAYVSGNQITQQNLPELISSIFRALEELRHVPPSKEELKPAVSVRSSVKRDYIICLDCGAKAQILKRHLATAHGLSLAAYRERWSLKSDYPMTAPGYSERRSMLARKNGLGRLRRH